MTRPWCYAHLFIRRLTSTPVDHLSDQTPNIVRLITNSAPEREIDLHNFLRAYPVRFREVEDATGIVMNAKMERVHYARKDLQVVWLVGFSLWKAIHTFAPAVLAPSLSGLSSASSILLDKELPGFEFDYSQRAASIAQIIEKETLEEATWPPDIPKPTDLPDHLSDHQDKAVYDLVNIATAVMFLHELRHVKFARDNSNGICRPVPREEERLCDKHARDWLMSRHKRYAKRHRYRPQDVCSKRAMALLIVCEFLRFAKDHTGTEGAHLYPPLSDRIAVLSGSLPLPDIDNYWLFSSCVLFAEARRRGVRDLVLPTGSPKTIGEYLLQRLAG